jgi:hypothetical protein
MPLVQYTADTTVKDTPDIKKAAKDIACAVVVGKRPPLAVVVAAVVKFVFKFCI